MILTTDRLKLDDIDINEMDDPIHHRIMKANKDDGFCNDIREAITEGSIKYRERHSTALRTALFEGGDSVTNAPSIPSSLSLAWDWLGGIRAAS